MAGTELAVQQSQGMTWNNDDIALIKETVAKGTSASEFKLFIYTAQKYGLDPLLKRIWCVKYGTAPAQIFTGRDGFLAIAHRSGLFDGMESGTTGDGDGILGWCRVYRTDMKRPFAVEVPLSEYSTGQNLWKTKPRTMIQKVAESQALRRAFDISGIYSPEEFDQGAPVQAVSDKITKEQASELFRAARGDTNAVMAVIKRYSYIRTTDIAQSQYEAILGDLRAEVAKPIEQEAADMFGGIEAKKE